MNAQLALDICTEMVNSLFVTVQDLPYFKAQAEIFILTYFLLQQI